jgi:hypothetical protein
LARARVAGIYNPNVQLWKVPASWCNARASEAAVRRAHVASETRAAQPRGALTALRPGQIFVCPQGRATDGTASRSGFRPLDFMCAILASAYESHYRPTTPGQRLPTQTMVFIHIGLHKTGTTYLQSEIFPKLKGIAYVPWSRFETFFRPRNEANCLISREGLSGGLWAPPDQREATFRTLSECFPEARILIAFRRHDSYIVSTYRQHLQQGGTLSFSEYFTLGKGSSFMKPEQFAFSPFLEWIERYFHTPPFVFFFEELQTNSGVLLAEMTRFLGADPLPLSDLSRRSHNRGLPYHAASILRRLNRLNKSALNPRGRWHLDNHWTRVFQIDPASIGQQWLAWLPEREFFSARARTEVLDFFREDWERVVGFAQRSGRSIPPGAWQRRGITQSTPGQDGDAVGNIRSLSR